MGCLNSKSSKAGSGKEYAPIGVAKFDDIFKQAKEISEKAEKMKEGLETGKMVIFRNTGMEWIKDPSLTTALQCWVYSCAAQVPNPEDFKPEVKMESPFVALPNEELLSEKNKECKVAIQEYIKTLVEAPESLKTMTESMQAIVDSANAAKDTASADFAELPVMEKAKAAKALPENLKKLQAAQAELQGLPDLLKTSTEDAQKAVTAVPEALGNAKDMVAKTKALENGNTDAETIAKEVLDVEKNDEAAAKKFAELMYSGLESKSNSTAASDEEAQKKEEAVVAKVEEAVAVAVEPADGTQV